MQRKQTAATRENILFQRFYHFIFICHGCWGVSGDLFKIYLYIYKIKLGGDLFNLNVSGDLFKILIKNYLKFSK